MILLLIIIAVLFTVIATFRYPILALAIFLTAGFVKGLLMLKFSFFQKVDYTVLCAVLTLIVMGYHFIRQGINFRNIISTPLVLYFLLSFTLLFGVTYTSAPNYGFDKGTNFATFGFIAFLAPIIFGQRLNDFKFIIWILIIVGIILAIGTIIAPHSAVIREDAAIRGGFLEASPLSTANKMASASVIAFVFAILVNTSGLLRIFCLVLIPIMIIGIIITGSRGPFMGLVFTSLVAIIICRRNISKIWLPWITMVLVCAVAIAFIRMPGEVTSRIANIWQGEYGFQETTRSRTDLFLWTTSRVLQHPVFGYGTGAFAVDRGGDDKRDYPHNFFLELMYEQGIIGLLLGIAFVWIIFKRWRQAAKQVQLYELDISLFQMVHIPGLLFIYAFTQAMKSGDITDNRFMFFCAGLILASFNLVQNMTVEQSLSQNHTNEIEIVPDDQTG